MCGIVGTLVFAESSKRVSSDLLVQMRDTMVHRGPDGGGLWVSSDQKVGFGHRRLSIIDLSNIANQPMCNEDGSLWVVFNGEIYNHAEIRAELEQLGGHKWKTDHSDTEVILHAFEQWGIECLQKFRGMFAIALWDDRAKQLWLIRDRIGIKPLYYSRHHGRLQFASEIKALLADPEQPRAVNEEGLFHYLTWVTTPSPQTLFAGVHKLPPATWMRFDTHGRVVTQKYWDVWDHTSPLTNTSDQEISEQLIAELRTAVNLRKVSDVPVGVFLSGGIDSSTNAALFTEGGTGEVKTFTVGYDDDYESYRSELHYARQVADQVGSQHHECLLSQQDLLNFLPQLIHLQDEPIGDPVCVPLYYVSQLARKHGVVVCQVGEGADELFWGYPSWKSSLRLQEAFNRVPLPRWALTACFDGLRSMTDATSHRNDLLSRAAQLGPIFWGSTNAFPHGQKMQLLSSRMKQQFGAHSSWDVMRPVYDRFKQAAWEPSTLNWMSYADLNLRLPELLLMRVDKMTMGASLEGRVPFLDHKMVELAMSIPQAVKTRGGVLKSILKKSVRGLIPDTIIDRPKQGFHAPVREWLGNRLGDFARSELKSFCQETDWLDFGQVAKLCDQGGSEKVWFLLNLAMWWKHFIANDKVQLPMAA